MPWPLWQLRIWMSTCLCSEATDFCMSPALRAWARPLPPAAQFFMSVSKAQGFSAQEESLLQWWRHSSPTSLIPRLALPWEKDRAKSPGAARNGQKGRLKATFTNPDLSFQQVSKADRHRDPRDPQTDTTSGFRISGHRAVVLGKSVLGMANSGHVPKEVYSGVSLRASANMIKAAILT